MKTASSNQLRSFIDLTTRTIERRSFHFRNNVIAVVMILLSSAVFPLILRSWRPLTILLLLPLIVNVFILADIIIISSWSRKLLSAWAKGTIDLSYYEKTIAVMKHLPRKTIGGMLRQLPLKCLSITKEKIVLCHAIAETAMHLSKMQVVAGTLTLTIYLILTISVSAALLNLSIFHFVWMLLVLPALLIQAGIKYFSLKRLRMRLVPILTDEKTGRKNYVEAAQFLEWEPYKEKERINFLSALSKVQNNPACEGH